MAILLIDLLQLGDRIRSKSNNGVRYIYCQVRQKWLVQQPEEMVRQLVIIYLVDVQGIRLKSIKVESNNQKLQTQRTDIVVYNSGLPFLLIECKSWTEKVNQRVMNQVARYNTKLQFPYCWVTNGKAQYMLSYNREEGTYAQIFDFPKGYT